MIYTMTFMKQFKTSTQIAIKFTLYFFVIFSFLGISINGIFFRQRVNNEYNRIGWKQFISAPIERRWLWWRIKDIQTPIITIEYKPDIEEELWNNRITKSISRIEDKYIMYAITDKNIKIIDISRPIEMQYNLLWTTLFIVLGGTAITFAVSRTFAKSSLKKINELVDYTQQLDIHNLTKKVPISWPEDDEIRIIAHAFQNSLDLIKEQTDSLKDFVSYASHELKTPLSTIRGLVDLITKTKNIEVSWPKIKKTLTEMSNLLDTLLLITKREFHDIQKEKIDIIPLINTIWEQVQEQHKEKKIIYKTEIPEQYLLQWNNEIIKIIISNILNNAYKFTPEKWNISLSIEKNTIIISDNGIGISNEDQYKIRTRFWKKSTENNNWYGLWLYMVKLLIEKLWRTIVVKSKINKRTTFTITMK